MSAQQPLRLTRHAVTVAPESTWPALAGSFGAERRLHLPGLLAPDLLATMQRRVDDGPFAPRIAARVYPPATDLKLRNPVLQGCLHFLFNDAAVVALMRAIARDRSIAGFSGAVYRMVPGAGHHDSWHSDVDGNRRVGLTVNLSRHRFQGGELSMRARADGAVLWTFANTGPGDGLLFAIDEGLQHRVHEVTGGEPKTALAGWFCHDADRK